MLEAVALRMAIHNGTEDHFEYPATQQVALTRNIHLTQTVKQNKKMELQKSALLILDNRASSWSCTPASLRAACLKMELPGAAILGSLNLALPVDLSQSSP